MKRKIIRKYIPERYVACKVEEVSRVLLNGGYFRNGCQKCGFRKFSQIKDIETMEYDVGLYCSGCDTEYRFVPRKPVSRFAGIAEARRKGRW